MRFTIRDLLLLTAIAAIGIAWWMDHGRLAPQARERDEWAFRANTLAERIRQHGDQVNWADGSLHITETVDGKRYQRMISRDWVAPRAAGKGTPSPMPMAAQKMPPAKNPALNSVKRR